MGTKRAASAKKMKTEDLLAGFPVQEIDFKCHFQRIEARQPISRVLWIR